MKVRRLVIVSVASVMISMLAGSARAQSAASIVGAVRDATGAVLPGVTVEAASPELIEKVKSAVTNDGGLYQIVDLRPGVYTVTFTLTGFSTVKREGLELAANFTATVNVEMRVGALEETITVSGASPVVDVSSPGKAQALPREVLDAIPTGRTAQSYAQLIPGVTNAQPDVGGAHAMSQVGMNLRGNGAKETTVMLDGIQLNGMCGDGTTQAYTNTQSYEEMVFQTSGAGADVATPGVRQNMVPRQGGNQFSGSFNGTYSNKDWQGDPINDDLLARGLVLGPRLNGLTNAEYGVGGKILQDRFWWFNAGRRITADEAVPDTFYPDGSQGINEQYVKNLSLRLTYQLSKKHKLTGYADRVSKYVGHDMQAGYDPATASRVWEPSKLYMQGQVKLTSTLTSRALLEVGYSQYQAYRHTTYQPGVEQPYGSAEWFSTVTHRDTSRGTVSEAAPGGNYYLMPTRRFMSAVASYVTGSHNLKVGVQDNFGFLEQGTTLNGALHQVYQNGNPVQVSIYNTPERDRYTMKGQWGVFGQDSFTYHRLTLNAGLRFEYFSSEIAAEESGQGRFVPLRTYGPESMPVWKTLSPRLGATYDLFGDAKTALKFSVNKYQLGATDGVAADYNPMRLQSSTVDWRDLNGDDVAQGSPGCAFGSAGCEINFAQLPANFGLIRTGCQVVFSPGSTPCGTDQVDPEMKRDYEWAWNVGIQRELLPRVSVSANWFYTKFYNLRTTTNTLRTFADYTPVQIASPLDGSIVTMYNVSSAKVSAVQNLNSNDPDARRWNHAVELGFSARMPGGGNVFGGFAIDRTQNVQCSFTDDPNRLNYCDDTNNDIPWKHQFKVAGSRPLKYGLQLGASFTTYNYILTTGTNPVLGTVWNITRTTRYPADCKGPCTPGAIVNPGMTVSQMNVPLVAPGTEFSDRIYQVDLTVGKWFTVRRVRLQPEASLFNAFNNHAAYTVRSMNYLTSSYLQPSLTLQPAIFRIGLQVKW
jgi:hypothetical protein